MKLDVNINDSETFQDLPIEGAWLYTPQVFGDERGSFHEWLKTDEFSSQLGFPFMPAQGNLSSSVPGTIRGLHYADVPPGQSKLVSCVCGRIQDVIVDLREGSDTFGQYCVVDLSADNHRGVYLPEGVGHGFAVPTDGSEAVVSYLVSMPFDPDNEHGITPFDPQIGIDWDALGVNPEAAILSPKDRAEKTLEQRTGSLPSWDDYTAWVSSLKDEWVSANEEGQ